MKETVVEKISLGIMFTSMFALGYFCGWLMRSCSLPYDIGRRSHIKVSYHEFPPVPGKPLCEPGPGAYLGPEPREMFDGPPTFDPTEERWNGEQPGNGYVNQD